jgi:RING finger protein 113A
VCILCRVNEHPSPELRLALSLPQPTANFRASSTSPSTSIIRGLPFLTNNLSINIMETKSNLAPTKDTQITFKKRGAKAIRRRPDSLPPSNHSDDPNNLTSSSDDELRQSIKRRKMTSVITASSKANIVSEMDMVTSARSTDRETILPASNNATKQSVHFKDLPDSGRATTKITEVPDNIYKGLANQTSYIRKNPNAPTRKLGPVKAPSNVRTITVLDYQPDTCKDYKTTGYCGFGDSW